MKKIIMLNFMFTIFICHFFGYDISDLNGHWTPKVYLKFMSPSDDYRQMQGDILPRFLLNEKYKTICYDTLEINISDNESMNKGVYHFTGLSPNIIKDIKKENDIISIYYVSKNYQDDPVSVSEIVFYSKYEILLTSDAGEQVFYKIDGPKPENAYKAFCNDDRVRVRTKPDLDSETWGHLYKGDYVLIEDKTDKLFEIDGENWYWYRVDAENLPDGWVYGKYLDIEECAEEN